jgi:hypothetical protein
MEVDLVRVCKKCNIEFPLTEEHFYRMAKWGVDGYSGKCRECFSSERLARHHIKKKNLQKIGDVQGKSKVPNLPKVKIKTRETGSWKRDFRLIAVIRCKYCNKIHEIRIAYHSLNCSCKHNLLIYEQINFLWSDLLYLSDKIKGYNLQTFDPWK